MQVRFSSFVTALAVVAVVELAHLLSLALVVRYALFPPLAVIAYLAFRDPRAELASWRSVILLPVAAAAVGILLVHLPEAIGIAIGLLAIFALMELSQAAAPPALAIVLLAFLLHISSWVYPLSVLVSTVVVYLGAVLLRRLTSAPAAGTSRAGRAGPGGRRPPP